MTDKNKLVALRQPSLEKLYPPHGGSVLIRRFDDEARITHPYWHYHPELELVYVDGGSGKRHIGSHLSYFHDGELTLIGSNLPHQGFTNRLNGHNSETVVQMKPDFLGAYFFDTPEMASIKHLLRKAEMGLSFHGKSKEEIGKKMNNLPIENSFNGILALLDILQSMALSTEYTSLNAEGFSMEVETQDNDRINVVFNHVRENFQNPISLSEMSEKVSMTEPSFCRYFKKVTGKTLTSFINEYRLVHASKLLAEKQISISEVCFESGFNNFSHFTKRFKSFTGKSPSIFRAELKQIVK